MKKNLLKTMLVAIGMAIGGGNGAWAYDVPESLEVKEVLLGTLNSNIVNAETFDADDSQIPAWTNPGAFSIAEIPTSSWDNLALNMSGKAMRLGSRSVHDLSFNTPKTSGKIVFSVDAYIGTHQKQIQFVDANDNIVAYFAYSDRSASNSRLYNQPYLFVGETYTELAEIAGTYSIGDTYLGTRDREYQITEFVIDLDNNTISYNGKIMDRRRSNGWFSDNATITFSSQIAGIKGIRIDATLCGNNTYYAYFDNMSLYHVDAKAGSYRYVVNAVDGENIIKEIASGTTVPDEDTYVYYPYAINTEDGWYTTTEYLGTAITNSGTISVPYTKEEDIVAFVEGEDAVVDGAETLGYSNGKVGHVAAQNYTDRGISMGELEPGKYKFVVSVVRNETRSVVLRDASSRDSETNKIAETSSRGLQTIEFTLLTPTKLLVNGRNSGSSKANQSADFDYVYIQRIGDATETVSVGESGLSTYCPTVDLDFSASLNINAYAAKINGDVVELTKVNTVKAGEGVLLSTEGQGAQTEEIAMASATEDNANDFIGVIEAMVLPEAADGDVNYVLSKKDGVVGFFRANNTNIAAGKAYLKVPAEAAAKGLKIVFGDTTGINEVAAPAKNDGAFYTLSGVRVENPVKGVYIQNGKKVVVK